MNSFSSSYRLLLPVFTFEVFQRRKQLPVHTTPTQHSEPHPSPGAPPVCPQKCWDNNLSQLEQEMDPLDQPHFLFPPPPPLFSWGRRRSVHFASWFLPVQTSAAPPPLVPLSYFGPPRWRIKPNKPESSSFLVLQQLSHVVFLIC